jgi:hypothetical protein
VEPVQLLEHLADLAREAGLEVRAVRGAAAGETVASSGICRVRGAIWVVLAAGDPLEEQIAVLVRALNRHAAEFLETRYLAPAVRSRLDAESGPA